MAKIIDISTDKTVVFAVREFLPQRFQAPGWTDLRIGFLLSIVGPTDPTDDNDPTAVSAEEIGTAAATSPLDRFFIGVIDSVNGNTKLGFTNYGLTAHNSNSTGTSSLVSSDGAIGAGTDFWRPTNGFREQWTFAIVDDGLRRAGASPGSEIHFAQDAAGAGYATLLMLRLQRDNAEGRAKVISVSTKRDTTNHTADVAFTNTPTAAFLESNLLATFPSPAQTLGPIELSQEPTALFLYWPWRDSRLRCHAAGIYKAA